MSFLLITVGTFTVATAVFHYLLFTKGRLLTDRFWKATDYAWLSVAVVGLYVTLLQREEERKVSQISALESLLLGEYTAQQAWIGRLGSNASNLATIEMDNGQKKSAGIRTEVLAHVLASQKASEVQLVLANKRPYIKHTDTLHDLITSLKDDKSSAINNLGSETESMVRRATPFEEELAALQTEVSGPLVAWVLKWISPVLLALAIAVRLTRVTAEVFVLKKDESWSFSGDS